MWFTWPVCCHTTGELLTRHFTLTGYINKNLINFYAGGIISVALSVGQFLRKAHPGVTRHLALWSPDFPQGIIPCGCPAGFTVYKIIYKIFLKANFILKA
jgi:hypothetical protein